jgi:hypothetical protein
MEEAPREMRRMATVREDWTAWLPEEKDILFDATLEELEVRYVILSVTLNEAFSLCKQRKLGPAREESVMFADLFDRLTGCVHGVLGALGEHGRRFGTLPNVLPLCADFFRSEHAQRVARANNLAYVIVLRTRGRFFRKLAAIKRTLDALRNEARDIAGVIVDGSGVALPNQWKRLEVLHYDLNTCLRETTVVLKSFLCVLPSDQLPPFRQRLLSRLPSNLTTRTRRSAAFLPQLPLLGSGGALCRTLVTVPHSAQVRQGRARKARKDNSRSKDRIPTDRMRPDGTGGPHETN